MLRQRSGRVEPHGKPPPPLSPSPPPLSVRSATTSSMDDSRKPLLKSNTRSYDIAPKARSDRITQVDDPVHEAPDASKTAQDTGDMDLSNLSRKSQWIVLAVASGACAAFNGVFAKLTTTELTTTWATAIANLLGLGDGEKAVEVVIRAMFFALNLVFNGVMWALFTKALARGTSTTQVTIINTSANFMITAVLGFIIFTEKLSAQWFVGALMLVAGNVIIGRREEKEAEGVDEGTDQQRAAEDGRGNYSSTGSEEDANLLEELEELEDSEDDLKNEDDEDVVQLEEPILDVPVEIAVGPPTKTLGKVPGSGSKKVKGGKK